ncbi:MAG: ATP-binding protein, partial [Pseudomonadota bacterium]
SAIGALAAQAAHELGTPLATIQLVAKEMAVELGPDDALAEDVELLLSQSARCREILGKLSSRGDEGDAVHDRLTLKGLFEEAAGPHQGDPPIIYQVAPGSQLPEPVFRRQPEILYGLGNLIENAADFARSEVRVTAAWTDETISIAVLDDGPGFPPDVIARLGEPYVTTRPAAARSIQPDQTTHEGLGLGFFIAKTLLERTGASVTVSNAATAEGRVTGARVEISWPRTAAA